MAATVLRQSKNIGVFTITTSKNVASSGDANILKQGGSFAVTVTKNPDKAALTYRRVKN